MEELYNPLVFKGLNEAEQFFENTEDIINEEELEESVCESRRQSPLKQNDPKAEGLTTNNSTENMLEQVKAEIETASAEPAVEAPQAAATAEKTSGEEAKLDTDKS